MTAPGEPSTVPALPPLPDPPPENKHRRDGDQPSSLVGRVAVAIVGFIFAAGFGWALVYELQHPPTHSTHIYIFAGGSAFGLILMALMASADYLIAKLGDFVRAILPSLPWARWRSNRTREQDEGDPG